MDNGHAYLDHHYSFFMQKKSRIMYYIFFAKTFNKFYLIEKVLDKKSYVGLLRRAILFIDPEPLN